MTLLEFLENTPNWQSVIAREPYCVNVRQENDLYLLYYDMVDTDFSAAEWLLDCRGSVVRQIGYTFQYVCRPFRKFFNWQEPHAATLDWNTAVMREKLDGTLIKLWYDDNQGWRISTSKMITPDEHFSSAFTFSFPSYMYSKLNTFYTYLFELIGPDEFQIVLPYDHTELCYLGCVNNITGQEDYKVSNTLFAANGFRIPTELPLNGRSFNDITTYISALKDIEGFVANDANFNRVKIKTSEYFQKHFLRGNGAITPRRYFKLREQGVLDDFIAAFPTNKQKIDTYIEALKKAQVQYDKEYDICSSMSRAEIARTTFAAKPYIFERLNGKSQNFTEWFNHQFNSKKIAILEGFL